MTSEEYQENIPKCCNLKTTRAHSKMLLFCNAVLSKKANEEFCRQCEFCENSQGTSDVLGSIWRE